jgi:phospholipid/cholesterol/gamma-HCH transport system ATP-binding protein
MADAMISVTSVTKGFGPKTVLDGVDLEVPRGQSLVVVGGSGAGKTVLLKHLIGLLDPDEGTVKVAGVDLAADRRGALAVRQRIGMSFQEGALFDSMTVAGNIAFPIRRHTRRTRTEVAERVAECLRLVRLPGIEAKKPSELSGGMRRRVGFARAIALEPELLLFDEPTTGLDPVNTAAIAGVINHLRSELGATVVTITHDMQLALKIADRIAMLRNGRVLVDEGPEAFQRSTDPYVRAFLEGELPEGEEDEL